MLDRKRLRAEILRHGKKQKDMARLLGMTDKTFSIRLREGWFRTDEVEKMMTALDLSDPRPIFFGGSSGTENGAARQNCAGEGRICCPLLAELAETLCMREEKGNDPA